MTDLVAGDTGSKLVITCKNNDNGVIIDLTGATIKLKYRIGTLSLQTKTMTIQGDAILGIVEYTFLAGELTSGELTAAVEITDAASKTITQLTPFILTIRAKL